MTRTRWSDIPEDINFNFELPGLPDTSRLTMVAGWAFCFGAGVGVASLLSQYRVPYSSVIAAVLSTFSSVVGGTCLVRANLRLRRYKKEFALTWANAKLRLKADLTRACPDDPVFVAGVMQKIEERAMLEVKAVRR